VCRASRPRQPRQVFADAAAVIEHPAFDPVAGGLHDQLQPALLPGAPNVDGSP
jgi:hypothetical protein